MNNLLERAQERILEMNRLMSKIEEIEQRMAGIGEGAEIAFYTSGTARRIDDLITAEQMECIIKRLFEEIDTAKFEYTERLTRLMGLDYDKALKDPIAVPEKLKEAKVQNEKPMLDVETVRQMYEDECRDMKEIAAHYGCAVSVISRFMSRNGIQARPRGGDMRNRSAAEVKPAALPEALYPELTADAVRELYTNGTMSLAETAKFFGISSSELHAFVEKHGLKKVPKKDKIFRDAGKLKP